MVAQSAIRFSRSRSRIPGGDDLTELSWDGVAELPHIFRPRAGKNELVWERLNPCGFAHGHVADRAVRIKYRVLATWDAVVANLKGFGEFIKWASSVARITASARLQLMTMNFTCHSCRYVVQWSGKSEMDTLTPAERSERMSRVRSKDTNPELLVRTLVHGMGFRYRLHDWRLRGNADPGASAIHDTQVLTDRGPR
jgi:hypothetical protein